MRINSGASQTHKINTGASQGNGGSPIVTAQRLRIDKKSHQLRAWWLK